MHEDMTRSPIRDVPDGGSAAQSKETIEQGREAARRAPRPTADEQSAAVPVTDGATIAAHVGRRVLYAHEPGKLWPADVTALNTNGSYNLVVHPDNGGSFNMQGVREGDGIGFYRQGPDAAAGALTHGDAPAEPTELDAKPPESRDVNPDARADALPGDGQIRTGSDLATGHAPESAAAVAPGTADAAAQPAPAPDAKTAGQPASASPSPSMKGQAAASKSAGSSKGTAAPTSAPSSKGKSSGGKGGHR